MDDMLVSVPEEKDYQGFVEELKGTFVFTEGGEASHFLGANLARVSKHVIQVTHTGYIRRMAEVQGWDGSRVSTPCDATIKRLVEELESTKGSRDIDPELLAKYRSLMGAELYTAVAMRPDAAYAVGMLCRCMTYPDERALTAARRVLAYLASHDDLALVFDGGLGLELNAYTDADWSTGPSTTGYILKLCGGCVAWKSVKQKCISMSSCEAELIAANATAAECVHLRHLLTDLVGIDVGTVPLQSKISCDNQGTIAFANTPVMTMTRMKHVTRDLLKIREWIVDKMIHMGFIPSKRNPADILTKALHPTHFNKLREFILTRALASK